MADPNLVNVATITAKTAFLSLANTNATTLLSNAASSGKVYKINLLAVANDDGSASADITISITDADDGAGTAYKIAHTIVVPTDSTLIVIDKNSQLYLQEDRSIVVTASAANDLDVIISYEELS